MLQLLGRSLQGADGTRLGFEEAGVAPLVSTLVDQLPLLALVERHPAVGADPALPELGVDVFMWEGRGFASREEIFHHCAYFGVGLPSLYPAPLLSCVLPLHALSLTQDRTRTTVYAITRRLSRWND